MSIKHIRITLKYLRKFFAGFVSITPFVSTKLRGYPFTKPENALNKDWLDIGNDIELTTYKIKSSNERKQK